MVSAVGQEAVSPWSVLNPVRYFRLADSASDSLRVGEDTSMISTMRFAWAMTRVNGENGLTCGVPIADLAVNWDQERADQLDRESKAAANNTIQEAEQRRVGIVTQLEQQRDALERRLEELRTFEREYRTRLKSYLESQLRDLDASGSSEDEADQG